MKKSELALECYFDFDLIGIISIVKEYKLAWHINEITNLQLAKGPDMTMEFSADNQTLVKVLISNFAYQQDHLHVTLLQNKLITKSTMEFRFLIEELQQFDYLLKYQEETTQTTAKDILSLLRSLEVIEYAAILEPSIIKSRDNLIF